MHGNETSMNRRTFVKTTGALGLLSAAGAGSAALFGEGTPQAVADEAADEKTVWTHCHVNCGGACVLQCHVKDGELAYVESDNTGDAEFGGYQARACLRGRSIRKWLGGIDRLNYPMKRVGARGEGKFEQISWEEALDTIANEFTRIKEKYGNESVFIQECSGVEQNIMMNNPFFRLFNLCGGVVTRYGNYSNAALSFGAAPFTYGDKSWSARSFKTLKENELVVLFGNAPNDTRMAGDGAGYDLNVARETKNLRIIVIDPRRSELATNQDVEWIPITPGTDAALVAGLAHVLISEDLVDHEFLDAYCIGYDENTLPEDAKGKNLSYVDYIMGTGYDKVEKTPAWASEITHIPEERIVALAHEIAEAKPCFIAQGWGPQRHTNGDSAARAIMLLPQLVGQVGKPGTNNGAREGNGGFDFASLPTGDNPIKVKFPNYLWPEAIKDGPSMTATNAGIKGADALPSSIKMLVNYGNNMMANQNGDINYTTDILRDENLCEFILQYDVNWTDSCNWADIVLPDLTPQETYSNSAAGENNDSLGMWPGRPVYEPKYERREIYEVCGELAKRLGVYDEYSDGGKTREDWCRELWEEMRAENDGMPSYDEAVAAGIYKADMPVSDEVEPFFDDPKANPLETATGMIQIYAPELAELAATWELPECDEICPIPAYIVGFEGPGTQTEEFPLIVTSFHTKSSTHSSYANNEVLHKIAKYQVWINPIDAAERGIEDGEMVAVTSARGEVRISAKVTNRIVPGTVALPQGAWHKADMQGDRIDHGGCINTLTSRHVNPVSKGTGQHTIIGQVKKVEA